jgi:hypothetical protein
LYYLDIQFFIAYISMSYMKIISLLLILQNMVTWYIRSLRLEVSLLHEMCILIVYAILLLGLFFDMWCILCLIVECLTSYSNTFLNVLDYLSLWNSKLVMCFILIHFYDTPFILISILSILLRNSFMILQL